MSAQRLQIFDHINPLREYDIYRKSQPVEHDIHVKGIPYIFITTPRMNFDKKNMNRDSFLMYLKQSHEYLFNSLCIQNKNPSPFIKILTNQFRGIEGKDLASRTLDIHETFYGYRQTLPISIIDSQLGDTISITYEELKYLPVVKLHKAWIDYTEKVRRGIFAPSEDAISRRYLDYVSSLYYFELDFDGSTILYWAKYTGLVPVSNPYAAFATDGKSHDIAEAQVNYAYSFKEDMNPSILTDFNKVSSLDSKAMRFTPEGTKGNIPYYSPEKIPFNYHEIYSKGSNVLVVAEKRTNSDELIPLNKYKLQFFA